MPKQYRKERIADLLREEVARILHEEFVVPDGAVLTVTRTEVSDDLEAAVLFVSVFPDDASAESLERLENFAGEVQYMLMKRIRFKPLPRIRFLPDKGIAKADEIDRELKRIQENEQDRQ